MALSLKVKSNVKNLQARYIKFARKLPRIITMGLEQAGVQLKTAILKFILEVVERQQKHFGIRQDREIYLLENFLVMIMHWRMLYKNNLTILLKKKYED